MPKICGNRMLIKGMLALLLFFPTGFGFISRFSPSIDSVVVKRILSNFKSFTPFATTQNSLSFLGDKLRFDSRLVDDSRLISNDFRLIEPIPVIYETDFSVKDFFPFLVVGIVGVIFSVISHSLVAISGIVMAETFFFLYCFGIAKLKLNGPLQYDQLESDRDCETVWNNIFSSVSDPQEFFRGWFFDVPFDRIRRQDVIDFISWALFSTTVDRITDCQLQQVTKVLRIVERETTPAFYMDVAKSVPVGVRNFYSNKFPPRAEGEEPLPSMRSTIEPLRWVHKPLALYLVLQCKSLNSILSSNFSFL